MRGRKPRSIVLARDDRTRLEDVAGRLSLPWYQVRRARIILARGAGERPVQIAQQVRCDVDTVLRTCERYEHDGLPALLARVQRPGRPAQISPLQRVQIVQLACVEPEARGLHITHWSSADLARQAVIDGIVPEISSRTVRRILQEVDLQPHRTRFWKTARLDAEFLERAVRILWCYSYAHYLAQRGYWVVCEDELPNFQILEREPIRRAIPGSIEQQEFEYTRHGTINILVFLVVHSGRMHALCVDSKDAQHYVAALRSFRRLHRNLEGVYLIHDGDPSHTAGNTQDYLADGHKWWRPCRMPVDASWLNQAESLLQAFEGRYLKRDSWRSREDIIEHINAAWPEYNRLYAHPFDWEWSVPKMRQWFAEHAS